MKNQTNPAITKIFTSGLAYFTCMKYRMTSSAFTVAMNSAMMIDQFPIAWCGRNAAATVRSIRTISAAKMMMYVRTGTCGSSHACGSGGEPGRRGFWMAGVAWLIMNARQKEYSATDGAQMDTDKRQNQFFVSSVCICAPSVAKSFRFLPHGVDQIEQRIDEDPDDVDEVPVQADDLDGVVIFGREPALSRVHDQPDEQAHADQHVQGVDRGHGKVEREEDRRGLVGGVHVR